LRRRRMDAPTLSLPLWGRVIASASVLLCSAPSFALSNITIMADNSASLAVSKLAREYARSKGIAVSTSFGGRSAQAEQILEGSAADILITTDAQWIEELQTQGLIDIYSRLEFARGKLALVGGEDSTLNMKLTNNFMAAPLVHAMNDQPALFIGNPEYIMEGKYAKQALRSLDALDVLEPYTLYPKTLDEMVDQVTRHNAFGVFMYAQALLMEHAKVIDIFPEKSHSPIPYYAVVIAGDNMDEARKFMKYLSSNSARAAINNSGLSANNQ